MVAVGVKGLKAIFEDAACRKGLAFVTFLILIRFYNQLHRIWFDWNNCRFNHCNFTRNKLFEIWF